MAQTQKGSGVKAKGGSHSSTASKVRTSTRSASKPAAAIRRGAAPAESPKTQATAKIFMNGRSQAVRLPAAFRLQGTEVFVRRDSLTNDIILSEKRPVDDLRTFLEELHRTPGIDQFAEDLIRYRDRSLPVEREWPWDE